LDSASERLEVETLMRIYTEGCDATSHCPPSCFYHEAVPGDETAYTCKIMGLEFKGVPGFAFMRRRARHRLLCKGYRIETMPDGTTVPVNEPQELFELRSKVKGFGFGT